MSDVQELQHHPDARQCITITFLSMPGEQSLSLSLLFLNRHRLRIALPTGLRLLSIGCSDPGGLPRDH
jgi:hypothetical protein